MAIEIINDHLREADDEAAGLANPEVVRETTEAGQVVWLISSPEPQPQENNASA